MDFKQFFKNNNFVALEKMLRDFIYVPNNVQDAIYNLYEMEYKWHVMRIMYPGTVSPQRLENLREFIRKGAVKTAKFVANKLEPIFSKWLEHHAITEPRKWAKNRLSVSEEYLWELRYVFAQANGAYNDIEIYRNYFKNISDAELKSEYPSLHAIGEQVKEEQIDVLKGGGDEDFEEAERLENMSVNDFLIDQVYSFGLDFFDTLDYSYTAASKYEVFEDLLASIGFDQWYSYWSQQGLDETRAKVKEAYRSLKEFTSGLWDKQSVGKGFFSEINQIIMVTHQTGQLLTDYAEQYGDINLSAKFLDRLSKLDPEREGWNDDLKEMGINTDKIPGLKNEF